MKNDRPAWVNKVFDQFLEDFKADINPTVNLRSAIDDLERGRIDPDLIKIIVKLASPKDIDLLILVIFLSSIDIGKFLPSSHKPIVQVLLFP